MVHEVIRTHFKYYSDFKNGYCSNQSQHSKTKVLEIDMIEFFARLSICLIITGFYFFFCVQYGKNNKGAIESDSLMKFPPFAFSIFTFFWLLFLYLTIEINSSPLSPRDAFKALDQHEFISFLFKCFIASSAIIIAWHRSIISSIQIKLQTSSNDMTNFYSLQKHIREEVGNKKETLNSQFLEITNKQLI
jgi:hypothetical protein